MPSTWDSGLAQERLGQITRAYAATRETKTSSGAVRHKCFVSYHSQDAVEVLDFVESFDGVFIPRAVGVNDEAPWIDSDDDKYVFDKIRDEYLADSTVTISLIGRCTWARKFIDWEISSSLRQDQVNRLNGLLAIQLPSVAAPTSRLPQRLHDNVIRGAGGLELGYARFNGYPSGARQLQAWIDDAFDARTSRRHLIRLGPERKRYDDMC